MQQTSLHAAIKDWYAPVRQDQEKPVDGYFIDVVRDGLLIEIQTRNFTAIRPKLVALLERHPVRLVHPIAVDKWVTRLPGPNQPEPARRKSPRRGRIEHLFLELVRIPQLVAHPNFSLDVLLIQEEELRQNDGRGSWRRRGWSIVDRRLLSILSHVSFETPDDFLPFIPPGLPAPFTAKDMALARAIPDYLARKMIYCFRKMDLLHPVGVRRRSMLFLPGPE